MGRITYADKVALNSNAEIPAQNKVNDVDMNNVKNAINQLGAYLSATVQTGQPGKCYITAPGTLASGDTFNVVLPTAVNPSANAQFSVDGGSNYYPIARPADAGQLLVSDVAGRRLALFFTGTAFLVIDGMNTKGKTIIIRKNQTQSMPATTKTRLTFHQVDAGYDSSVFDLVTNGILLKSKFIKTVSIIMGYQITDSVSTITYVDTNTSQVVALGRAAADSGTMSTSFNATKDDTIYFAMYPLSATTVTSSSDWNWVVLTVLDTYE